MLELQQAGKNAQDIVSWDHQTLSDQHIYLVYWSDKVSHYSVSVTDQYLEH